MAGGKGLVLGVLAGGVMLGAVLGCGPSEGGEAVCEDRARAIGELEPKLFAGGSTEVAPAVRDSLLFLYADFANACHDDPRTPEMLFRRADLLRSRGAVREALNLLRDIHDHYPTYPKRARAAFLVGFLSEVELNDREQARTTYQQVMEVHPGTEEARWAQEALANLDLTPGQILSKLGADEPADSALAPR